MEMFSYPPDYLRDKKVVTGHRIVILQEPGHIKTASHVPTKDVWSPKSSLFQYGFRVKSLRNH